MARCPPFQACAATAAIRCPLARARFGQRTAGRRRIPEDAARDVRAAPQVSGSFAANLVGERAPAAVAWCLDYALLQPRYRHRHPGPLRRRRRLQQGPLQVSQCWTASLLRATSWIACWCSPYGWPAAMKPELLLGSAAPGLLKNDIAVVAAVPASAEAELDRLAADYPADLARLKNATDSARRRALSAADFALCLDTGALTPASLKRRNATAPCLSRSHKAPSSMPLVDLRRRSSKTGTGRFCSTSPTTQPCWAP